MPRWIIFPKPAPHPEPKPDPLAEVLKQILARLERIERLQHVILHKEVKMAGEIDALAAEVADVKSVEESAAAAITKIVALLQGAVNAGDLQRVADLTAQLKAATDPLAAAIATVPPDAPPVP